jgi:hypothetical protein
MPKYDFQVQLEKNASMVLRNPVDGTDLQSFSVQGHIMKGCSGTGPGLVPQDTGMAAFANRPDATFFQTLYSFGDFYAQALERPLSMKQNPNLEDSGVEIRDDPANDYPRTQYWSMYAIFTVDLAQFKDPQFRIFNVGNRQENPIRLRCRLNRPWGEEIPIRYELIDAEVPLFPWDIQLADFAQNCPITGGSPKPLALLRREGDNTLMRGAWTAASNQWNR